MISLKFEQCNLSQIPCEVKKKPLTECFQLLKEAFDEGCMSRTWVLNWYKQFLEGREEVELFDQPVTSRIGENIQKINEIICKDRHLSIRMMADMTNIDRETIRKILHEDSLMIKCIDTEGEYVEED